MALDWSPILKRFFKETGLFVLVSAVLAFSYPLWGRSWPGVFAARHVVFLPLILLGTAFALSAVLPVTRIRNGLRKALWSSLSVLVFGWALLLNLMVLAWLGPRGSGHGADGTVVILFGLGLGSPILALAWGTLSFVCSTIGHMVASPERPEDAPHRVSTGRASICLGLSALLIGAPIVVGGRQYKLDQLRAEASSPASSPSRIRELFARYGRDPAVSYYIAQNASTPPELLKELVDSNHPSLNGVLMNKGAPCEIVLAAATKQPNNVSGFENYRHLSHMPDYVRRYLDCRRAARLSSAELSDRLIVAKSEELSVEEATRLMKGGGQQVLVALAQNTKLPREIYVKLAEMRNEAVSDRLATNPGLDFQTMQEMILAGNSRLNRRALLHASLSAEFLREFYRSHPGQFDAAIATNRNTPTDVLEELGKSGDRSVLFALRYNSTAPESVRANAAEALGSKQRDSLKAIAEANGGKYIEGRDALVKFVEERSKARAKRSGEK